MGWGGRRPGAGAKPKPKPPVSPFAVVRGGQRLENALTMPSVHQSLCDPPDDLAGEQQAFWQTYAQQAVENRTLTPATVAAFRLLCDLHAKKTMVGLMVDKGALGGLRVYMQLAKQVENLMGRFCLAPFGKPVAAEKSKPAANPFAALGSK